MVLIEDKPNIYNALGTITSGQGINTLNWLNTDDAPASLCAIETNASMGSVYSVQGALDLSQLTC